jgi:hypothetical protein
MVKTKKREPLFNNRQLKEVAENLKYYQKILNKNMLLDILNSEIENRVFKRYLEKNNIMVHLIEKEYEKEIKMIYQTILPEKYKKKSVRIKK